MATDIEEEDILEEHDPRTSAMLKAIAPYAKKVSKNLTDVKPIKSTKNTRLAFILLPEWSTTFPPFNIARLSSIAMTNGYETKCWDFNVKIYKHFRNIIKKGEIDYDPWDGARSYKWVDRPEFEKDLLPHFEDKLEEYIQEVLDFKPDCVGFSMYYCNEVLVLRMAREIKKRAPNIKLLLGGPGMQIRTQEILTGDNYQKDGEWLFDYAVVGEAEQIILEVLKEIEDGVESVETIVKTQNDKERINLNNFPIPDYRNFDFNDYEIPNGVLTEFSRGCVAKCTFCEETHFWNYRQRTAVSAIREIETLYNEKGSNVVWFLDSLVNGNLNELRAFCKAVVAKELTDLKWTGYARCDHRMDDEYFKDLSEGGCFMLNYGCESGSDRVLEDIDKRVTKGAMEKNFQSAAKYGIDNMTNWIVGFPTEQIVDFVDTMLLLWRNKDNRITVIATAPGFGLSMQTIVGQNPERFGLDKMLYLNYPYRKDWTLTKIHVLMRVKYFSIFTYMFTSHIDYVCAAPSRPNLAKKHYTLEFTDPEPGPYFVEWEWFDYNIIKFQKSKLVESIANESFGFFRMLWLMKGGFKMNIKFREDLDFEEFGQHNACPIDFDIHFEITKQGKWKYKASYKLTQPESYFGTVEDHHNMSPFKAFDFSYLTTAPAKRARKLSKLPIDKEGNALVDDIGENMDRARFLNSYLNLSFDESFTAEGQWSEPERKAFPEPIRKKVEGEAKFITDLSSRYNKNKRYKVKKVGEVAKLI